TVPPLSPGSEPQQPFGGAWSNQGLPEKARGAMIRKSGDLHPGIGRMPFGLEGTDRHGSGWESPPVWWHLDQSRFHKDTRGVLLVPAPGRTEHPPRIGGGFFVGAA